MNIYKAIPVILYLCCSTGSLGVYEPSASDIDALRISVLNKIDTFGNEDDGPEFKPLIGSILRLVFHDCSGPYNPGTTAATNVNTKRLCDGCIDLDKLDHGGLQSLAVEPLEEICSEFADIMNRADCWAAIGNVAIEYSHSLAVNTDPLPKLPYFFGREQCQLSPNAITGDDPGTEFPLAHLGWDPLMEFFATFFEFTVEEVTAIMGAHTVGAAHKSASGFEGKWTKDSFAFNNDFYVVMLDKTNQWDQTPPGRSGFPQWTNKGRAEGEQELLMLNSDMSLIADFEAVGSDGQPHINEDTGIVTCRWEEFEIRSEETCGREDSFSKSLDYALDNALWLRDFAAVWTKLVIHNQPELLRVDATDFEDRRESTPVPVTAPTEPPVLIIHDPASPITPSPVAVRLTTAAPTTPSPTAAPTLCCIAKRIPNWNGRCWGALSEDECNAVLPAGKRCYWDANQCRTEQICLLRGVDCVSNAECCSERCRSDTSQCR